MTCDRGTPIIISATPPPDARIACSSCGDVVCRSVMRYRARYVALCQPCRDAVRKENTAFRAAGGTFDEWIERLNEIEAAYTWYVRYEAPVQAGLFEETG